MRHASLAALLVAAACSAVGPDYKPPEMELPAKWHQEPGAGVKLAPTPTETWWAQLDDPLLDTLVQRAVGQGLDVRQALSRVHEARAVRGVAAADYYPSVNANASFRRYGESDNTPFGAFVPNENEYVLGADASWEIDLWGRVRRSVEAADADLAATEENARDVAVSIAGETAIGYLELRGFQKRLAIAQTNVDLQQQTLTLARGRFEAGLVSERDVAQAATNVESTRSRLPELEIGVRISENHLAVLLGLPPGALADEFAEVKPIPVPHAEVAVGVPADLLHRRADVRRAERVLAAETARIGVAKGDLYPRLSLLGSLGISSEQFADLFQHDSNFFSIGPTLRWNIFDAGRLRQLVTAQDARAEQALIGWQHTVLVALEETEAAMTGFLREQARRRSLVDASTQARHAVELAQTQYGSGLSDFQTVLDSERVLADLEDDLAQSEIAITRRFIFLYKALGGEWGEAPKAVAKG
jgi:NodT family efflux transporter outer membrane factor (OMF) lipoprotein